MTLQQPIGRQNIRPIFCHKCGAPIVFSKDQVCPSGRKIPLDPYFNNEPHAQHCMYFNSAVPSATDTLFIDFLSLVPNTNKRQKRIIGAAGKAK